MKKLVSVLLVALLSIGLVGCGNNEEPEAATNEDKEVTIYLVRHGKTWFNTTNQVQGYCDSPLTEVGEEQAKKVGVGLKDIDFVGAYSSDLGRQRNTAKLILEQNDKETPDITEINGFREKNFGSFEGRSNDNMNLDIVKTMGVEYPEDGDELWAFLKETLGEEGLVNKTAEVDPLQAAENWDQIIDRGSNAMDEAVKDAESKGGGNVLIVSSGGIIPVILESIAPGQYQGEKIGNCSVTILKYKDGKYTVDVIGDTQYVD